MIDWLYGRVGTAVASHRILRRFARRQLRAKHVHGWARLTPICTALGPIFKRWNFEIVGVAQVEFREFGNGLLE
jgi:hypothetical protein